MRTAALPADLATRSDEIRQTVATNIDALLKSQRWSRRAAAMALGISHRYVNDRAAGDVDVTASDLAMFADFLDVPVSRFFAETQNGPASEETEPLNVPPTGVEPATYGTNVRQLDDYRTRHTTVEHETSAPVYSLLTGERVA